MNPFLQFLGSLGGQVQKGAESFVSSIQKFKPQVNIQAPQFKLPPMQMVSPTLAVPQFKIPDVSKFLDFKISPQGMSMRQVWDDVNTNPTNYNLFSQLAQKKMPTGFAPLDFAGQGAGNVGNFLLSIPQSVARFGYQGAQQIARDNNAYQPKGFERLVFGGDPLKSFTQQGKDIAPYVGGNAQLGTGLAFGLGVMDAVPVGGGSAKTKAGKEILKRTAKADLRGVLTYADEMLKAGYTPKQIDQTSYKMFKEMGNAEVTKEVFDTFKSSFSKWIGARDVAKTTGTQIASKAVQIPVESGMDIVKAIENPSIKLAPQLEPYIKTIRKEFDDLYTSASRAGVDVGYLKNYITHIWKQSPEVVEETFKRAGQTFKFSKERNIQTYEEGMKLGLSPRYTHPAEILGHYAQKLEETKANIKFIEDLKQKGLITEKMRAGFSPIVGTGIREGLYAPHGLARQINRVFSPEDTGMVGQVLDKTGQISGKFQDITLSGGIPASPLNAFSFAQLTKEFLAGRVTSPISSVLRSLSKDATLKYFAENVEQIKKMQSKNIPMTTNYLVENMIDKGAIKNLLGENVGDAWNKIMSEPTFQRLLPQLQLNLFNDVERQALKSGKNAGEALEIASKAVKMFYGVEDTGTTALKTKLGDDILSTFLFAPKYRQSMINFWLNNLKALKNPLALENRANTTFLVGSVVMYLGMDQLNRKYNGHGLQDNPSGMEDKLLIPMSDGYTLGIPFLSSIATIPRGLYRQGKMMLQGDFEGAGIDAYNTYASSIIKPIGELATNRNYFGQEIYNKQGTGAEIAKDVGLYAAGLSHPYIRAGIEKYQGKNPDYQIALKATELPFRFYKTKSLEGREYYAKKDELDKTLNADEKKIADYLTMPSKSGGADSRIRAEMMLKNPKVLQYYKQLQLVSDPQNPLYKRSTEDIQLYLAYQATDDTQLKAQIRAKASWLPQVQRELAEKFSKATGTQINPPSPIQRLTPEGVQIVSTYTSLPQGSQERKQLLAQYPWLKQFWNDQSAYYEQYPTDGNSALKETLKNFGIWSQQVAKSGGFYGRGGKKIKFSTKGLKGKAPKGKQLKIKAPKIAFKPLKVSKLKMPKASKLKYS